MSRYFIKILILLLISIPSLAQELDEEDDAQQTIINVDSFSQFRFGIDMSRPVWNYLVDNRKSYEFEVDYYYKKELYFVGETGWGNAVVDYPDLRFRSNNTYYKLGISKSMLKRQSSKDWDLGFIGARYGIAPIKRSEASYVVVDSFWGNTSGIVPAQNLVLHWVEIVGGVKVEVAKGLFLGWTARAKFRLNKKPFQELPPSYITGYGKGDKGTIFDFNFYVDYAIRWRRASKSNPVLNDKEISMPGSINIDSTGDSTSGKKWKGQRFDQQPTK